MSYRCCEDCPDCIVLHDAMLKWGLHYTELQRQEPGVRKAAQAEIKSAAEAARDAEVERAMAMIWVHVSGRSLARVQRMLQDLTGPGGAAMGTDISFTLREGWIEVDLGAGMRAWARTPEAASQIAGAIAGAGLQAAVDQAAGQHAAATARLQAAEQALAAAEQNLQTTIARCEQRLADHHRAMQEAEANRRRFADAHQACIRACKTTADRAVPVAVGAGALLVAGVGALVLGEPLDDCERAIGVLAQGAGAAWSAGAPAGGAVLLPVLGWSRGVATARFGGGATRAPARRMLFGVVALLLAASMIGLSGAGTAAADHITIHDTCTGVDHPPLESGAASPGESLALVGVTTDLPPGSMLAGALYGPDGSTESTGTVSSDGRAVLDFAVSSFGTYEWVLNDSAGHFVTSGALTSDEQERPCTLQPFEEEASTTPDDDETEPSGEVTDPEPANTAPEDSEPQVIEPDPADEPPAPDSAQDAAPPLTGEAVPPQPEPGPAVPLIEALPAPVVTAPPPADPAPEVETGPAVPAETVPATTEPGDGADEPETMVPASTELALPPQHDGEAPLLGGGATTAAVADPCEPGSRGLAGGGAAAVVLGAAGLAVASPRSRRGTGGTTIADGPPPPWTGASVTGPEEDLAQSATIAAAADDVQSEDAGSTGMGTRTHADEEQLGDEAPEEADDADLEELPDERTAADLEVLTRPRVRIDTGGRGDDSVALDQSFTVVVETPRPPTGEPPDTLDVTFTTEQGTESLTLRWDGNTRGPVRYTSNPVTMRKGGEGRGRRTVLGMEFSTGGMSGLSTREGETVTISYGGASVKVDAYTTWVQQSIARSMEVVRVRDRFWRTLLIELADLEPTEEVESLRRQAETALKMSAQATRAYNDPDSLDPVKLAAVSVYASWLSRDLSMFSSADWQTISEHIREQRQQFKTRIISSGMQGVVLGLYRTVVGATPAKAVWELASGQDIVGSRLHWSDRVLAALEVAGWAGLAGGTQARAVADNLSHLRRPRGRPRPRSDAPPPSGITSARAGQVVEWTEEFGVLRNRSRHFQSVADRHGVRIRVRATNRDALTRVADGHPPKPEALKSKTINELDTFIGAPRAAEGLVGYFRPIMPTRTRAMSQGQWKAIQDRYRQRMREYWDNWRDMTKYKQKGLISVENGVVIDRGLSNYRKRGKQLVPIGGSKAKGGTGKGFTGDHDLFDITRPDGSPLPEQLKQQVLDEVMSGVTAVQHGAHKDWNPARLTGLGSQPYWQNVDIDAIIRRSHAGQVAPDGSIIGKTLDKAGKKQAEALLEFSPGRPPMTSYDLDDLPTIPSSAPPKPKGRQ